MVAYDAVIQQKRRYGHRISLTTPGQPKLQSPGPCSSSELSPSAPASAGWGTSPRVGRTGRCPAFLRDSSIAMSLMLHLHFGSRSSRRSSLAMSIWVSAKRVLANTIMSKCRADPALNVEGVGWAGAHECLSLLSLLEPVHAVLDGKQLLL